MTSGTIICCAITGSSDTKQKNPAVPVTPEEIAQSSLEAARAGAAIVHIHVRDPRTTQYSMEIELYREVVERIRSSNKDLIINLTTGAGGRFSPNDEEPSRVGPGTTLVGPAERVRHVIALRPEICSLDMGSMNMSDQVFVNSAPHLRKMAAAVSEAGVCPELEVFDAGHVGLAEELIANGLLPASAIFQICLGVRWGQPATTRTLLYMTDLLPQGHPWFAFGVGKDQFRIVAQCVLLGGNVRVGLEDNLYLDRGVLASSNASLVEKAAHIVETLGGTVASPDEARQRLGLHKRV